MKTVSDLSAADRKRFIAMMQKIVTARSKRQPSSAPHVIDRRERAQTA